MITETPSADMGTEAAWPRWNLELLGQYDMIVDEITVSGLMTDESGTEMLFMLLGSDLISSSLVPEMRIGILSFPGVVHRADQISSFSPKGPSSR